MEERNSDYELIPARNGMIVPVVRGVYLHSIYEPLKEANVFAQKHTKQLEQKNLVILLGLGFGYHLDSIETILRENHTDYHILVLEPNTRLVEDFMKSRYSISENITIYNETSIRKLFFNKDFVEFLAQKPAIIKHDSSFLLEKDYYTEFLTYQAPTSMMSYKSLLNEHASKAIAELEGVTLSDGLNNLKTRPHVQNKETFLLLALEEINKLNKAGEYNA